MWHSDDADFERAALTYATDGAGADVEPAMHAFPPGRAAGLARLEAFSVAGYARGRNAVTGERAVSALSPYLRHGLVTLVEARDHALAQGRSKAGKFVQELAWREYWRHVLDRRGRAVFESIEAPKHAHGRAAGLPDALARGETALACVDASLAELRETGYVHNHARMWFASATTHHFQRDWPAGAALFEEHLLDHDPASNSLSWQWVESSFAHKPYLYNRGNVEKYGPELCAGCPCAAACPFEASYEALGSRQLGAGREAPAEADGAGVRYGPVEVEARPEVAARANEGGPVVWVHASSLGVVDPALAAAPPTATVAVVLDAPHFEATPHSAKRLAFQARSALETAAALREAGREVRLAVADPAQALASLAPSELWVTDEPDPWIRDSIARLRGAGVAVQPVERALLAPGAASATDHQLGRFSRWWRKAEREAFEPAQLSLGL